MVDTQHWQVSERAAALHADALVWDDHAGFESRPDADLAQVARWREAGVDHLSVNVCFDVIPWQRGLATLAAFRRWFALRPDSYRLADTVDDVLDAKRAGKLAITFDIEGMTALNHDPNMVAVYHRLGVRHMLFAYNLNNEAGGGCHDEDVGLSDFGREVVAEMNRVGMVVDCSHSAYRTTMEAMEVSVDPVVFSHSNPAARHPHGRNIRDDQIRACAATGGVVGVNGVGRFLGDPQARTGTLADAIDHVVSLVGTDHVGIGLDFAFDHDDIDDLLAANPRFWPPAEYGTARAGDVDVAELPRLTETLLARGHAEAEVRAILGGNFLRVARAVWKAPA